MSDVYEVTDAARAEIKRHFVNEIKPLLDQRAWVTYKLVYQPMTAALASAMYWEYAHKVMRAGGVAPVNPDGFIRIQCHTCKRISSVKRDVKRFTCCGSEQFVCRSRDVKESA